MFNNKQYPELQYLCCYLPRLVGSLYLKTVVSWLRQVHSQMAGGWGTHFGPSSFLTNHQTRGDVMQGCRKLFLVGGAEG